MNEERRLLLCLDFDGVIHSYISPWAGVDIIPDPPVHGAIDFILRALGKFRVAIFSSRNASCAGVDAMKMYLMKHGIPAAFVADIEFPVSKPPAFLTIDDRAVTFNGTFPAVDTLLDFQPWNKPGGLRFPGGPKHTHEDMLFGEAIERLKCGERVSRAGWNGKGMWLALQRPDRQSKMSLPFIYMKTATDDLVPWLASQTDMLAEDWAVVK
jgi:hypothetical protein